MENYFNPCRIADYGPQPFAVDIDKATKANRNYRAALWTGKHLQTTLMCIPPCGDIGLEIHSDTDQFLRVESGQGMAVMGCEKNHLDHQFAIADGYAVFVPAGTWHNLINTGNCPLKLYSIYAPPHHPHNTVHTTKAIADAEGD
ncbi:MAG: cupin domain-containing protein [Oscillospiraceae bacterium]|nr:cupin domain-containing protein [Oscillospiraceae bacterium]